MQEERQRKEKDLQLSSQHLKFEMQTELQQKVRVGGGGGVSGWVGLLTRVYYGRVYYTQPDMCTMCCYDNGVAMVTVCYYGDVCYVYCT